MVEIIKKQYSYFYRKVFKKRPSFSKREEACIITFSELLEKEYGDSIGEQWLFDFLTFQFNKYSDADTQMSLQLHWILGQKALEMWRQRSLEHHKYFDDEFKENFNIKKSDLIKPSTPSLSKKYKSDERNRFKGVRKFLHCDELELFDINSPDCRFCKFKEKCEKK